MLPLTFPFPDEKSRKFNEIAYRRCSAVVTRAIQIFFINQYVM